MNVKTGNLPGDEVDKRAVTIRVKVVDRIARAAHSVQSCRMTVEKLIHEEVD